MKMKFFAMAAVAIMASACTSSNNNTATESATTEQAAPAASTTISGMEFTISELNGSELKSCSDEEAASIAFEADKVNAYVGCNRIFATPTYGENGHIALEMGGATRMACPDGCREDEFLEAFNKLDSYELTETGADFKDCSGAVVFRGVKK